MIYHGDTWWFYAQNEYYYDFNTNVPVDTEWHHHAITYDGETVSYYLDGEKIGVAQRSLNTSPNCKFTIGIKPDFDPRATFNGVIDEVRLWDFSRSQADIQADMYRELTGGESGLVGYWNFNEGSGQVISDSSPNSQDGFLGSSEAADSNDPEWVISEAPLDGKPDKFSIISAVLERGALPTNGDSQYQRWSNLFVMVHHPEGAAQVASVQVDLSALGGGLAELTPEGCTYPQDDLYCGAIHTYGNVPTGDVTLPITALDKSGNTASYDLQVKVIMLMYDIVQQLRTNPSAILGQEVWTAAMVTESFTPDTITIGADIVETIDLLISPSLVGILMTMIGKLATSWTNSQLLVGTHYYEFENVLMVSWKPDFNGADFLPLGIPYYLRVRVGHSDPLHMDFDYLEVLEYQTDTPSTTHPQFSIPSGYTFYDYREIQTSAVPYGAKVCTIGVVTERYTIPSDWSGYAFLRISQQPGDTPFLVMASGNEPMPNLGDLALVCGEKFYENLPVYDSEEYGTLYDVLETAQGSGFVIPYRGLTTSLIHGHEYIGDSALWLTLQCPADFHIYDDFGNHTGAVYDGSGNVVAQEEQIPGSFLFYGAGDSPEKVLITNPLSASYRIDVRGEDSGTYIQTIKIKNRSGFQTFFSQTDPLPTSTGQVDTTLLEEIPAAPSGLQLSHASSLIQLDWDDNTESDLLGYWVYRSALPGGAYQRMNVAPLTSSAFTDSSPGGAVMYYVTAQDSSGNESGHMGAVTSGDLSYLPLMVR